MISRITRKAGPLILAGVLLFAMAAGANAQARDVVATLIARVLTVQNSATINGPLTVNAATTFNDTVTAASTLAVTGNASVAGTLSANGNAALAGKLGLAPQTAIAVTEGSVITLTGALQRLTSAGDVTATLGLPGQGEIVTLFNSSNTTITIEDTTGQAFSANAALAQWDTITIFGYGNSWYEIARSNN